MSETLFKKILLWHRWFPVNFAKNTQEDFLRTLFLPNTSDNYFCTFKFKKIKIGVTQTKFSKSFVIDVMKYQRLLMNFLYKKIIFEDGNLLREED